MNDYLLTHIEALQKELSTLQMTLSRQAQGARHITHLQGLWEGIEMNEEDFAAARQAVFCDAGEQQTTPVTAKGLV